jgi:hypothetical protein
MGHLFNCCPFVDDRLRQLFREEMMNTHQHVLPTTTIVVPNVFVLGIQVGYKLESKGTQGGMTLYHIEYVEVGNILVLLGVIGVT